MAELIAILSGKGGTGKTSVCAGIAQALAMRGEKILCIDCDVGLRNLDIALGLSQLGSLSFLEVCQGEYSLDMATVHPDFPGLSFLTAPMNCPADAIDADAFGDMLNEARSRFDYVFLDAPAGIEAGFRLAARYADRILLVTGSDPAAVRDAERAAQVLELMGKTNVRLIVNRVNEKMIKAMGLTVDDIMDDAGIPLLGIVPEDSHVILAAAFKQPLLRYTKKGAAAACKRIARRLQGMRVPVRL
jgi:septum site-determining protein MinD